MRELERELAGTVGSTTAHTMLAQVSGSEELSVEDLFAMADETAEIMEYSQELELRSSELAENARKLREVNLQLTEISSQKDAFLSQVSHELRTPMTSIRSFSEIMRDTSRMPLEEQKRFASIIHDESVRLTHLLDEILDLSFLESGQAKLNIETTTVNEVVQRALNETEALAAVQNVTLIKDIKPKALSLETDSDRMAQVLINLVSNAIKYGANKTPIVKISARTNRSGEVIVKVADNGPGISESDARIIFEKFTRATTSGAKGSAGLGLAISREIMRNLRGNLRLVRSGKGATFELRLPQTHTIRETKN